MSTFVSNGMEESNGTVPVEALEKENVVIDGDDALTSEGSTCESNEDHETPEYVPGSFEGPEKTMEVWFRPNIGQEDGLRSLSRETLDHLCKKAKCTILSKISSNYVDAYVLSESSLFIYKYKYIMKTCGTTTLLRCLGSLLHAADNIGMELQWVGYSRKNLNNPSAQKWPHSSFDDEILYLSNHDKLQERLCGSGYILGPVTGDHWFVYCADHSELPTPLAIPDSKDITVNIMMFDMAPSVASHFFRENNESAKDMTMKSGIYDLCPGATIDDCAFSPCGYSMNAILHDTYSTIHITPEPECSYASFETNAMLPTYLPLVRNVLNVFKPKRFVLTIFGDEAGVKAIELPTEARNIMCGPGSYSRISQSSAKMEGDLCCIMGCYVMDTTSNSGKFSSSGSPLANMRKIRSQSFIS